MQPIIAVDTRELEDYSRRLGTLHRSAFPNAVRGTLNSAAFHVKKDTLLKSADKNFVNRQANFFKANSRVEKAQGWSVEGMTSRVGMVSLAGNNKAVDDLEQQEHGGTIKSRSFIPMKPARTGNSPNKNVRKNSRISGVNNLTIARNARGKNERQRFVKSVIHAGVGGHVLSERGIVWRVNSLARTKKNKMKLTPIHSFKKGRTVDVKATHFMQEAAIATAKKIPYFYKLEAERIFKRHLG